ncbi:hypothetical protein IU433_12135 [Nocardia puris]|uniref:hypothetical protein n=1 Tax=Nocardia puris TaxID=208602 RepID=UPI001893C3AD|nr:hypothetical protein [Nocardia puris]MBF6459785.1 hypothetical protein [Nocardia puris]
MGTHDALGLICLDLTTDLEADRRLVRRLADDHKLDLVDVMTYRVLERPWWCWRLLKTVHDLGVHAVAVPGLKHIQESGRAIGGVADLITPSAMVRYSGYGAGHTRPSRVQR